MHTLLPFAEIGAVGVIAHVIEQKLERNGYGSRVVLVKAATYVACALIAYAEWRAAIFATGQIFGIHVSW